ncbi:MAG: hypothetical protein IJ167_07335, partial [Lachnospiraceae bacterium]|nr:hypothetical protein [Lachnospiraceae bacterium]
MILWTNGQGLIDCDSYWFVPAELPILCEYNLNEGKIIRSVFLNNYTAQIGFHYALEKINNKIVLIPARDMNIYVYNLEDDTLTALPMEGNEDDSEKYVCCAKYGENIYMFPRSRATIIRFNVETMKIDYINSKCMENEITDNKLSTNFSTILNNKVYIVMLYSNRICVFDMEKETEKVVEIGDKDMR